MQFNSILLTAPYQKSGGVATFVNNIRDYLPYKIYLFYRGEKCYNKIKTFKIIHVFLTPLRFVTYLIVKNPSIVFVNTSLSKACLLRDGLLILIAKLFNKKVLLFIHGFEYNALKYKILLYGGYFKADSIIVLSHDFQKELKRNGYSKNIYTLYHPIPEEILNLTVDKFFDDRNFTKILFMARIEENKGIFITLNAFSIVQKVYPEVSLIIAGLGNALEKSIKYVNEKNIYNVEFVGFVTGREKYKLLKETDIYILPTYHAEGLPVSILEAMAAGLIVITRPIGGIVDLYEKINFGAIIESLNPEEYAKVLLRIIKNKKEYTIISKNNIRFAKTYFNPTKVAENISEIIKTL